MLAYLTFLPTAPTVGVVRSSSAELIEQYSEI